MMPSTNTRQDTSVLMYLKVLLISIFRWHGGGKGLGGTPASLPPLVTSAGTEERIRLELEPLVQEVLVGGVRTSSVPRRDGVAWAGGNPFSSPQTPNKPQASSRATKARPHRLAGGCMLQRAPGRVQQRLRCCQPGDQQGNEDRALLSATPATPLQTLTPARPPLPAWNSNLSLRANGNLGARHRLARGRSPA